MYAQHHMCVVTIYCRIKFKEGHELQEGRQDLIKPALFEGRQQTSL